jgi:NIPSNAP
MAQSGIIMTNAIRAALGLLPLLARPSMAEPSSAQSWPIIELRQYTLRPGQRDALIDLFEREFIESQEELGMKILGTFRDLDRPDRFVWIRGFRDMSSRVDGLNAFYSGPVWQAHRNAANATMIDSDNVLLLHEACAGSGLTPADRTRPPKGATEIPKGLVVVYIYSFAAPVTAEFVDFFDRMVKPELQGAGVTVRASYVSERGPNNFPRLPVRENEYVFVWFSTFADPSDYERCLARLAESAAWRTIGGELQAKLKSNPEVLRLQPTPRSALRAVD